MYAAYSKRHRRLDVGPYAVPYNPRSPAFYLMVRQEDLERLFALSLHDAHRLEVVGATELLKA
jgi:hypothetical protein